MKSDLVSIIIPVYNTDKYIKECLESIVRQTYRNIEIILVDDGSTDQSKKICLDFAEKDSRICYYYKKNGGSSSARNYGIERCKGKYICFVDSDDVVSHDYIRILYRGIRKYGRKISSCGYTSDKKKLNVSRGKVWLWDKNRALSELLDGIGPNVVCCNKLYDRRIFEKIRFPEGRIYEDIITNYYALELSDGIVFADKNLYFYRKREGSNSRGTFCEKNFELKHHIDYIWNDSKKYLEVDRKRLMIGYMSLYMTFVRRAVLSNANIPKEKEKLTELVRNNIKQVAFADNITRKKKIELLLFAYLPAAYRFLIRFVKA